jgi:hypothetical protein
MNNPWRRTLVASLFLAVCLSAGCNPFTAPFLFSRPESDMPARMHKLAKADKKKDTRVAILSYNGLETRAELIQADRQLSELLARHLQEQCKVNEEKVTVVSPRKVEEYKNNHSDWHRDTDLGQTVGRYFKADYVIYLEFNSLTLYEPGSRSQLYHGKTNITVSLYDMSKPDEPPQHEEFSYSFPSEAKGGVVPVGDVSLAEFRQSFLNAVARKLTWYWTAHPGDNEYEVQ